MNPRLRKKGPRKRWIGFVPTCALAFCLLAGRSALAQHETSAAIPPAATALAATPAAAPPAAPAAADSAPGSTATPLPRHSKLTPKEQQERREQRARKRAEQAFGLLAQGLALIDAGNWQQAREPLAEAWKEGKFPNAAFHYARVLDHLQLPEEAARSLDDYFGQADLNNPNYAAALEMRKRLAQVPVAATKSIAPPASEAPAEPSAVPWVVAGTGVALLVASITTALLASAADGELKRNCADNVCDPKLKPVKAQGKAMQLTTNILLATGGVAVAAGITWGLAANCNKDGCAAVFSGKF